MVKNKDPRRRSRIVLSLFAAAVLACVLVLLMQLLNSDSAPQSAVAVTPEEQHHETPQDDSPVSSTDAQNQVAPAAPIEAQPVTPTVRWRERTGSDRQLLPLDYDTLQSLAMSGNADAAQQLGEMLIGCNMMGPPPLSDEEFAAELRMIREEYRMSVYVEGVRRYEPVQEAGGSVPAAMAMAFANSMRVQCNGFPMDKRSEGEDWVAFSLELRGDTPAKPLTELQRWEYGDPAVLAGLSDRSRYAYEAGEDPAGMIRAYAYFRAYSDLFEEAQKLTVYTIRPTVRLDYIEWLEERLRPAEIAEGNAMAAELIAGNSNCCLMFPVRSAARD